MIFKEKDREELQGLELALRRPLPRGERQRLLLAWRRAGLRGEEEATYHINFHLANLPNWAVIHDLRVEWKGRTAQIDHLLMSQLLEIYVVESKSFRTKVCYANGRWEQLKSNDWEPIPSPVEQNERHILVLKEMIHDLHLAPTRLGLRMQPTFYNVIVVEPSCSVPGKYKGDGRIYWMDALVRKIGNEDPPDLDQFKIISQQSLHLFASKLVAYHSPAVRPANGGASRRNTAKKFSPLMLVERQCDACGGGVSAAEARFCKSRRDRFEDRLLCRKCQASVPQPPRVGCRTNQVSYDLGASVAAANMAHCSECGVPIDQNVVTFCRENSNRFDRRLLCRGCQGSRSKIFRNAVSG